MNCERARDLMHDRIDGMLSEADGMPLDSHLSSCPACNTVFARLSEIDAGLAELRLATALPEVSTRSYVPRRHWTGASRIAAGVVFAIGIGLATRTATQKRVVPMARESVAHAPLRIKLTAKSAERYLPIVEETERPDVHIVWLHRTLAAQHKDVPTPTGDGASLDERSGATLVAESADTMPNPRDRRSLAQRTERIETHAKT